MGQNLPEIKYMSFKDTAKQILSQYRPKSNLYGAVTGDSIFAPIETACGYYKNMTNVKGYEECGENQDGNGYTFEDRYVLNIAEGHIDILNRKITLDNLGNPQELVFEMGKIGRFDPAFKFYPTIKAIDSNIDGTIDEVFEYEEGEDDYDSAMQIDYRTGQTTIAHYAANEEGERYISGFTHYDNDFNVYDRYNDENPKATDISTFAQDWNEKRYSYLTLDGKFLGERSEDYYTGTKNGIRAAIDLATILNYDGGNREFLKLFQEFSSKRGQNPTASEFAKYVYELNEKGAYDILNIIDLNNTQNVPRDMIMPGDLVFTGEKTAADKDKTQLGVVVGIESDNKTGEMAYLVARFEEDNETSNEDAKQYAEMNLYGFNVERIYLSEGKILGYIDMN